MGFWFFMLAVDLLIPLTMLLIGLYFSGHSPKNINYLVGYRTSMSMKNKETWEFAHHHCGKLWRKIGIILLPLTLVCLGLLWGKDEETLGFWASILCFVQLAVLIASIFPTEIALRRHFDKKGNRLQP